MAAGETLDKGKALHLATMDLATAGKRDKLLTPRMPANTWQST